MTSELIERSRKLLEGITPGPWTADDRSVMGCRSVMCGDDILIACVEDAPSAANARLIAAAPTLIAEQADALKASSQRIKELEGEVEAMRLKGWHEPTEAMIEAARQASDWVADLRDDEISHIYLAMRAAILQQKETSNA